MESTNIVREKRGLKKYGQILKKEENIIPSRGGKVDTN